MKLQLPWWLPFTAIAGVILVLVTACGEATSGFRPSYERKNIGGVDCVIVWKEEGAGVDCNWPPS